MVEAMIPSAVAAVVLRLGDAAAVVVAVIAVVVVLTAVLLAWRARRGLVRRVKDAALRVEPSAPVSEHRRLERNLARLERAIDAAVLRASDASVAEARLAQALEAIPQGVVVCDENGEVVYRN